MKRQEGTMTGRLKGRRAEGQEATSAKRQEGTMTGRLEGRRVEGLEATRGKRTGGGQKGRRAGRQESGLLAKEEEEKDCGLANRFRRCLYKKAAPRIE